METLSQYDSEIVPPSALSEADVAAWKRLSAQNPSLAAPHLTYTYSCAAEKVFFGVRVCKVLRGNQVVAFFPFQFASSFQSAFGIGERIGGQLSDYFGVVAQADTSLEPRQLLKLARLNALRFTNMEESQSAFGLSGDRQEIGHRIEFPHGGRAYWDVRRQLDRRFVADTERREEPDDDTKPVPPEPEEDDLSEPTVCLMCRGRIPAGEAQCPSCGWTYRLK